MTVFSAVESMAQESHTNQKTEHPISKSVREHLKALLEKPLTVKSAREVRRIVDSAMTLLMAFEGVDGHLDNRRQPTGLGGYNSVTAMPAGGWTEFGVDGDVPMGAVGGVSLAPGSPLPIVPSSAAENFGTTAIRELIGAFTSIRRGEIAAKAPSKTPTLNELMEAYTMAKGAGSSEISTILETRIKKFLGTDDVVGDVVASVVANAGPAPHPIEVKID